MSWPQHGWIACAAQAMPQYAPWATSLRAHRPLSRSTHMMDILVWITAIRRWWRWCVLPQIPRPDSLEIRDWRLEITHHRHRIAQAAGSYIARASYLGSERQLGRWAIRTIGLARPRVAHTDDRELERRARHRIVQLPQRRHHAQLDIVRQERPQQIVDQRHGARGHRLARDMIPRARIQQREGVAGQIVAVE